MTAHAPHDYRRLVRLATCYDEEQNEEGDDITFELPEDLTQVGDDDLAALRDECVAAFDELYQRDDETLTAEDVEAMQQLADAADAIRAEEQRRADEREANRQEADQLAQRVRGEEGSDDSEGGAEGSAEGSEPSGEGAGAEGSGEGGSEPQGSTEEPAGEPVMASGSEGRQAQGPISVTLPGLRRRQQGAAPAEESPQEGAPALLASADLGGQYAAGDPLTLRDAAEALSRRANGINEAQYRQAHARGSRLQNSVSVLNVQKPFTQELTASADDGQEVLTRAANESRLPGESLVAAGGWCSPSETVYDLFEMESDEGLVSLPEINVARGGVRFTRGPDFASLFADQGFTFTEQNDIDGDYDPDNPDSTEKPCFEVACPTFIEERLDVHGLCITAGILQNRAYPEVTERTIRGALIGHQHRMAGEIITALSTGSTAVAMPGEAVGTIAPILSAIEMQVEHYRYVHRMPRGTTLEAIFPFWLRGMVRADLSRRLGVDLFDVSDQRIGQWFADRGINTQWVYNYQDLTGAADGQTAWPTQVSFLLYAAGTWVRGSSDLISMEAIFDSALLRQNDFTALFTEEGWLVARLGHDSREVTVPICPDGATHGGVNIECDGTLGS